MITADEAKYIRSGAYVPEHTVSLMTLISQGEPFLVEDCLSFAGENWVILVGYPFSRKFVLANLQQTINATLSRRQPEYLWLIAPEIPPAFASRCPERERDQYYTLPLQTFAPAPALKRSLSRAARDVTVERGARVGADHQEVITEFLGRERPGPRIERLFRSLAAYTAGSTSALVLTARRRSGEVAAFYVVDLDAERFATYVVGCHSKAHYVPGASDLLFAEMVSLARDHGKAYIHLGLGVNEGIRRFKAKWGGAPFLRYEFCEYRQGRLGRLLSLATRRWP